MSVDISRALDLAPLGMIPITLKGDISEPAWQAATAIRPIWTSNYASVS